MNKLDDKAKKLIEENFKLVNSVVNFMTLKYHGIIDRDDLIEFGIEGLIDASVKYDSSKNENFKKYAVSRIKGSILDEIRKLDYLTRNAREASNKLEKTYARLEQKLGRIPEDTEAAEELGISLDEFNELMYKIRGSSFISDIDFIGASKKTDESLETIESGDISAVDSLIDDEKEKILKKYIDNLDDIEKNVLMLYYYNELTLKNIGKILNLTESRICQIHSKAILKLRTQLKSNE
ncbi:MAG: FliA/WhiG family RNA polymerase sigma factor [bacterium]